ncbi:hypothetical protein DFH08DRAFT_806263 [Mycena albidolilacea]|uniref:Uncharacterized protein n=1 Tax=Mycena albidolilacea TaxID=1033008 RepID=A0AAD7ETV7_9AGAR|nr:hypothetical protein DFH08DRAFT_806263 [Mycena albidolilacea]
MYFTFNSFVSLATLLTLVNVAQGCSLDGGFCGAAAGGTLCCAGLTCTTSGVSHLLDHYTSTSNLSSAGLSRSVEAVQAQGRNRFQLLTIAHLNRKLSTSSIYVRSRKEMPESKVHRRDFYTGGLQVLLPSPYAPTMAELEIPAPISPRYNQRGWWWFE